MAVRYEDQSLDVSFKVRLSRAHVEALEREAESTRRSVAQIIRIAIEDHFRGDVLAELREAE